jgi:predicted acyl esterase
MSNNYNDNLFPPNQMFDFYQKLTGPKKFVVNRGIHATAEISGILGLPNRIWSDVHRWFDYWFMGKQNGILDDGPIAMEHKGELEYFDNLPMTRGLTPVPLNPVNPLVQPNGVRNAADEGVIEIATWWDSGATSGIPLLSPILDAYTPVKVWKKIRRIRQDFGALFVTEPLAEPMTLRGIPQLETWVKVKDPESQFIAYLYDVNRSGWGKLLSHGVISLRDRQVGEVVKIDLDLNTLATDVETGHRVALVVDGSDPLYDNAPARTKYFDMNHQGDQKTRLYLPDMPLPVR